MKIKEFLRKIAVNLGTFKKIILTWVAISLLLAGGLYFGLDKKIITVSLVIFAFLTQAFSGLLVLIGAIPFLGPLIVKVLSVPFFWILNGLGYLASLVAIKKGHGKEVITYRILTVIFLIGVVTGFILGRVIK